MKVDIECIFLFLLKSKAKYTYDFPILTSQTRHYSLYKTYNPIMSDLNIKIIIATITQYKIQASHIKKKKIQASFPDCSQLIRVRIK